MDAIQNQIVTMAEKAYREKPNVLSSVIWRVCKEQKIVCTEEQYEAMINELAKRLE